MTKLISWNVNGLRACMQQGFQDFFTQADADVFCIQESKLQAGQIDLQLAGYHQHRHFYETGAPVRDLRYRYPGA